MTLILWEGSDGDRTGQAAHLQHCVCVLSLIALLCPFCPLAPHPTPSFLCLPFLAYLLWEKRGGGGRSGRDKNILAQIYIVVVREVAFPLAFCHASHISMHLFAYIMLFAFHFLASFASLLSLSSMKSGRKSAGGSHPA